MKLLLLGILLGLGAAVPIGPVNLEIIRRNLHFGTAYGIATGLGACMADIMYLTFLYFGVLSLLTHPILLSIIGMLGSLVLIWFAIGAFKSKPKVLTKLGKNPSLVRFNFEGFAMTAVNPFTILFWGSIASQLSLEAFSGYKAILLAGLGVILGTIGWVLFINTVLHFTRHRLSDKAILRLNYFGGVILLGFALTGFIRAARLLVE